MRKIICKTLCVLLIAALLISMTGCSSEKKALLGDWVGEVDFADGVNQYIAAEDELVAEFLSIDSLVISLELTFNEDDTYSMTVDPSSVSSAIDGLYDDLYSDLEAYMFAILEAEGISAEDLGMTLDAILELSGLSFDEMMEEYLGEEMIHGLLEEVNQEGNFEVNDGKLYLSAGLEYGVDTNTYEEYTLEDDVLTLHETVSPEEIDETVKTLYPMVFYRAD